MKTSKTDIAFAWNILKKADTINGSFIMLDGEWSFSQKLYSKCWIFPYICYTLMGIYTAYKQKNDLPSLLNCLSLTYLCIFAALMNYRLISNRMELRKTLNWGLEVQALKSAFMTDARRVCTKFTKFLAFYFIFIWFMTSFGTTALNYMVPHEEKYRPPIPFMLPVEDQDQLHIFLIKVVIEFSLITISIALACLSYGIFGIICVIYQAYLDVISEKIDQLQKKSIKKFEIQLAEIVEMYNQSAK